MIQKQYDERVLLVICPPVWPYLPPLGLAYCASFIKHKGYDVHVFDVNITLYNTIDSHSKKKWLSAHEHTFHEALFDIMQYDYAPLFESFFQYVAEGSFTVIGFSVFSSNRSFSVRLAREVRRRFPAITIVFGGPEVMAHTLRACCLFPSEIMETVDYMVVGEGEEGLWRILTERYTGELPSLIESNEYDDLDSVPFPTFEEFDCTRYQRTRALPILASRGCIRWCRFCSERLLSKRFRMRSAEHIVQEIKWHKERTNVMWFTFHDSLINGDHETLRTMCQLLIKDNVAIKWEAQAAIRPDMDVELLSLMRDAGCFNLFVGLESGSDRILRLMHKGYTTRDAEYFLENGMRARMHCEISLIVGFPGEGEEELNETITFLKRNRLRIPKIAQVNPFIMRYGTPIYYIMKRQNQTYDSHAYAAARDAVERLNTFLNEYNFTITRSFINNLIYEASPIF